MFWSIKAEKIICSCNYTLKELISYIVSTSQKGGKKSVFLMYLLFDVDSYHSVFL